MTAREHAFFFFFIREKGESYPFTDNTTRLLDVLYSGPLRVLSVERLLCVPPLLVDFFLPVWWLKVCKMKSLERSALLNNPEGLTPKTGCLANCWCFREIYCCIWHIYTIVAALEISHNIHRRTTRDIFLLLFLNSVKLFSGGFFL